MEEVLKRLEVLERRLSQLEQVKKPSKKNIENSLGFKDRKVALEGLFEERETSTPLTATAVAAVVKKKLGYSFTPVYCGRLLNHLYPDAKIQDKGVKKYYLVEIKQ